MTIQNAVIEAPTAAGQKLRFTPEEYLAREETAEYKSEYHDGEIVPMTGGSINHNRIAGNIYGLLYNALRFTECEAFGSDMRLWVSIYSLYTYPDITVICGAPLFYGNRNDTITNPVLIIEVLSPSTEDYDRGRKFQFYRTLPSLQAYLLIHQDLPYVEHFQKLPDGRWVLSEFQGMEAVITLESPNAELRLERIYERVAWSSEP
jgi:Uma2 family endonuclease